ncbi:enoyl hydratase isomerase [Chlorella sorokiniana]|uniref:Enoyl hydratase isomerase n=1 Tax=Chlorella sorokiniana TaxID=3076 RepID=A0A2P6TR83_CHLSO|nr:enoyl hydratase isomerase [Chlorella sorokiniana]|eukprot:PRW56572.1 enoyl hydratase isomerase [Chlorella sorokiniana]
MASESAFLRVERHLCSLLTCLQREPVNAMSLGLWRALAAAVERLEADPEVRGVIIASGLRRPIFTAGQDLREIYAPLTTKDATREVWLAMNGCLRRIFASPLATIAAIKGACPAGGCLLTLACDRRIITDSGSIGLNEVAIGIPLPLTMAALAARVVGTAEADRLALSGAMLAPAEALRVGLVDEVVPGAKLMAAAEAAMLRMLCVPEHSRAETKRLLRSGFAREWEVLAEAEAGAMWERFSSPEVVASLGAMLRRLSKSQAGRSRL